MRFNFEIEAKAGGAGAAEEGRGKQSIEGMQGVFSTEPAAGESYFTNVGPPTAAAELGEMDAPPPTSPFDQQQQQPSASDYIRKVTEQSIQFATNVRYVYVPAVLHGVGNCATNTTTIYVPAARRLLGDLATKTTNSVADGFRRLDLEHNEQNRKMVAAVMLFTVVLFSFTVGRQSEDEKAALATETMLGMGAQEIGATGGPVAALDSNGLETNPKTGKLCLGSTEDLVGAVDLYLRFRYQSESVTEFQTIVGEKYGENISDWCLGASITNLSHLFSTYRNKDAALFNEDISGWDVSRIQDMTSLFSGASVFNQPLNTWDVSNVVTLKAVFTRALKFNQPLDTWNTAKVTDVSFVFESAKEFNQPVQNWNTARVIDFEAAFRNAVKFNQPLERWDLSSAVELSGMFNGAFAFNQPLNNWNVATVEKMTALFLDATSFNQPLNNWQVISVNNLRNAFFRATSFNQDLCQWGPLLAASPAPRIDTAMLFRSTSCTAPGDPNIHADPPGPFCRECLLS